MDTKELYDSIVKTGLCTYGAKQYRLFLYTSAFIRKRTAHFSNGIQEMRAAIFMQKRAAPFLC